LIQSARSLT